MIHTAETTLHRMFGLMIPTKLCVRRRGVAVVHVDFELGFFSVVSLIFKSNPKTGDYRNDMNIED
jgi:hypothetical protein